MKNYPKADATVNRAPARAYTVTGTGPFRVERDGDHGTFRIVNANGTPAKVTTAVAASAGFSGSVTETTTLTFATEAEAQAIVDDAND